MCLKYCLHYKSIKKKKNLKYIAHNERSEGLTAVSLNVQLFCDVTACVLVNCHRRFKGS